MKAKFKRLISSLLLVSLLVSTFSVFSINKVRADGDLIAVMTEVFGDDANINEMAETASLVIGVLQSDGYSPAAIAGVLSNFYEECHLDPFAFEGNYDWFVALKEFRKGKKTYKFDVESKPGSSISGGLGLGQWSFERHVSLNEYCKNSGQPYLTIENVFETVQDTSYGDVSYICEAGTQMAFMVQENKWNDNAKHIELKTLPNIAGLSEYKTLSDPTDAALYFMTCWEVCGGYSNKSTQIKRSEKAPAIMNKIVNGKFDWAQYADKAQAAIVGEQLIGAGYWNEDQLGAFCRVMEINVDNILAEATRTGLGYNEMEGLATWERNIKYDNEDNGIIGVLRRIVMLLGIALVVWMTLVYFAYWFDRISVVYLDVLGVVTLGHLHMSETEEECTFRVKDLGKEGRKTVNHRAIVGICLVGIAFGVLLISGWYYVALQKIVHLIQRLLRKVG